MPCSAIMCLRATRPSKETAGEQVLTFFSRITRSLRQQRGFRIILRAGGRDIDASSLPWPAGSLINRLSPALHSALQNIYSNDGQPLGKKLGKAVRHVLQGFNLSDLFVLPAYAAALFLVALGTAVWDAFRFSVLKTPVEKLLAEPGDGLSPERSFTACR